MFRTALTLLVAALGASGCLLVIPDPEAARAAAIAVLCLALWLSDVVPAFVPTLLLLVLTPVALGGLGAAYSTRAVLGWTADPVLLLFFGGFVLGEAASHHGIDRSIAGAAIRAARGRSWVLVVLLALATAFLSMWMSNIAAAALMITSLRPMVGIDEQVRRAILVAVALAANLGGMATPIGSGPNGIAIAAMPADHPVTFVAWMAFAVPLTLVALAAAIGIVLLRYRVRGVVKITESTEIPAATDKKERPHLVALIAGAAVLAWLTEALHGVSAATVALTLAAVLFGSGLLPAERVRTLDWSTLILIAGGVALGRLVEHSGLLHLAGPLLGGEPELMGVGALLLASAFLSSVMSNTATATLLVPMAMTASPDRAELPLLVALAASFGMPFVVSTPPNAMVVGAGVPASDLFLPGVLLLVGGVVVLTVTGPVVLGWFGY